MNAKSAKNAESATYDELAIRAHEALAAKRAAEERVEALKGVRDQTVAPFDEEFRTLARRRADATADIEGRIKNAVEDLHARSEIFQKAHAAKEAARLAHAIPVTVPEMKEWVRFVGRNLGVDVYHADDLCSVVKVPKVGNGFTVVGFSDENRYGSERAATEKLYLAFRRQVGENVLVGWMRLDIDGHRGGSTTAYGAMNGSPFLRRATWSKKSDGKIIFEREPVESVDYVKTPLAQFLAALGKGSLVLRPRPEECDHERGAVGHRVGDGSMAWRCSICGGSIAPPTGRCALCGNEVGDLTRGHGFVSRFDDAAVAKVRDHDAVPSKGVA